MTTAGPQLSLIGGLEGFPEQGEPYQVAFAIPNRAGTWQLSSSDWKAINGRLNRERPAKEVGCGGWHVFPLMLRQIAFHCNGVWSEYEQRIYGGKGVVGDLRLIFRQRRDMDGN